MKMLQSENTKSADMIFCSYGFRSPVIGAKLAKVIERCENKTCVIIPFAGFDPEKTANLEKEALVSFGFLPQNITCADDMIGTPDYIYIPGGDPFKLLQELKERDLLKKIKNAVNNGATFIGVSAGAYIATSNIGYVENLEDNNYSDGDLSALNLISENIICHYDHYSYEQYKACTKNGNKLVIAINDSDLAVLRNGKWKIL